MKITYGNKSVGDLFRATEANEIKSVVNDNFDLLDKTSSVLGNIVTEKSDFPEATNGIIPISGAWLIKGEINMGTDRFEITGDTQFIALDERNDRLVYTGTGGLIRGEGHSFSTKFLSYVTPNGKVFDLEGEPDKLVYILSSGFFNCSGIGDFEDFRFVAIKLCRTNQSGSIRFSGNIGKTVISGTPFEETTAREVIYRPGFTGGIEIKDNWFFREGGEYIEVDDPDVGEIALITGNRFNNINGVNKNFVGFDVSAVGFIIKNNTNQEDSGPFLDAEFVGNETPQTVTTDWSDINTDYVIGSSRLFEYDEATKSFEFKGIRKETVRLVIDSYIESKANNRNFEFALFKDTGEGFEIANGVLPYRFRNLDDTKLIAVSAPLTLTEGDKFKLQVRKPTGTSDILCLSSKCRI